mgnify:FL=1
MAMSTEKSDIIRELALRTTWQETEELPLMVYDIDDDGNDVELDASDGGKYWLKFRDASGQQKVTLQTTLHRELTRVDHEGKEYTERFYNPVGFIEEMLRTGVLAGGVVPAVDEATGNIVDYTITSKNRSQFVRMLPDKMLTAIVGMAIRFLYSEILEQVVDDSKNLPDKSGSSEDETENPTTKQSSKVSKEESGSLL